MENVLLIGIAGGSGSAKTTLARRIVENFGDDVTVIRHDNYYKRHDELPFEKRCCLNYDEPGAFDTELLIGDLKALRSGAAVECPVYDFADHNRSHKTLHIEPKRVIIGEGILIFADERLSDLFDLRIFVDTDPDVRILRRALRDVKERGRSVDSVVTQYLATVKPMHERYVEPSKKRADIIVPEGGHNRVATEMIVERIRRQLNKC